MFVFCVILQKNIIMQNLTPSTKGEVAIYQPDNSIHLEVLTDQETVWLSQAQMMELFETTKQNISLHIRNIFKEKELQKKATVKDYLIVQSEGTRQVQRVVSCYNLDIIISVGYRVKSQRGTQFRIWANQILKDYLLRGYAINARIDSVEHRVSKLEFQNHEINNVIQKALPLEQGIFSDGRIFDAYVFVSDLIKSAKKSIILIDNYVDESVLLLLSKRKKKVSAKILTAGFNETLQQDLEKHNAQYPPITIEKFAKSHDRFLILDNKEIYLIGASLKDLGKKWFGFSKMENDWVLSQLP